MARVCWKWTRVHLIYCFSWKCEAPTSCFWPSHFSHKCQRDGAHLSKNRLEYAWPTVICEKWEVPTVCVWRLIFHQNVKGTMHICHKIDKSALDLLLFVKNARHQVFRIFFLFWTVFILWSSKDLRVLNTGTLVQMFFVKNAKRRSSVSKTDSNFLGFSFVLSTNITAREGCKSFFPIIGAFIPWIIRKTSIPEESITEKPLPAPAGCTHEEAFNKSKI